MNFCENWALRETWHESRTAFSRYENRVKVRLRILTEVATRSISSSARSNCFFAGAFFIFWTM